MERIAILCKKINYESKSVCLNNISFLLRSKEILTILSTNKEELRTLFKIMLNIIECKDLNIKFFNRPFKEMNYILNFLRVFTTNGKVYPDMKVYDYLKYIASFYEGNYIDEINYYLNYFNLDKSKKNKDLKETEELYLKLISAVITSPQILILDSLFDTCLKDDPKVIDLINLLKDNGTAILSFSTNISSIDFSTRILYFKNHTLESDTSLLENYKNIKKISYKKLDEFNLKDSNIINYNETDFNVSFLYNNIKNSFINKLSKLPIDNLEIKDVTLSDLIGGEA